MILKYSQLNREIIDNTIGQRSALLLILLTLPLICSGCIGEEKTTDTSAPISETEDPALDSGDQETQTDTETDTETDTDTDTDTEEPCDPGECWEFEAETDFFHEQGYPEGDGWACTVLEHSPNRMLFGPYTEEIRDGWFSAEFQLMTDDASMVGNSTDSVLLIDVYDSTSGSLLAQRQLYRGSLDAEYAPFELFFYAADDAKLEFRAWWNGTANVNIDKVQVRQAEELPCDDNNSCTIDYEDDQGNCVNEEMALLACDEAPCPVDDSCLYVIDAASMSEEEATMIASLQGILAQHRPGIWLSGNNNQFLVDLELNYGVSVQPVDDPWFLVDRFASQTTGYLLADFYGAQSSLSVASSLSGVFDAVIADVSVEQQLIDRGMSLVEDVRDKDEPWVLQNYVGYFSNAILIEQREAPDIGAWYLRDLAASEVAFTWHQGDDPDFRRQVVEEVGGGNLPYVLGWASEVGGGEYSFVYNTTLAGGSVIPADYSSNLSVLGNVVGADTWADEADPAPVFDASTHYVAFVLSDGDNLQWMQRDFLSDSRWWNSPLRGSFPMTWGVATPMVNLAPSVLSYYASSATGLDSFVAGPSGAGYTLPSYHPDIYGHAEKTDDLAASSNIRLFTLLDSTYDGGNILSSLPYLEQPNIDGVLYDSYGDNDQNLIKYNGKLAMGYTHYLWNSVSCCNSSQPDSPSSLVDKLNAAPRDPVADIDSYSLVFVHCWSQFDLNGDGIEDVGSMEAISSVVSGLVSNVQVVTAPQLFDTILNNFDGEVCGDETCDSTESCETCAYDCGECTSWTYDAVSDFGHNTGQADTNGWSASPGADTANHLAYGPYVTGLDAGDYQITFSLMIDDLVAASGQSVAGIDVFDANSGTQLSTQGLSGADFSQANVPEEFTLDIGIGSGTSLEFRVWWPGNVYLHFGGVVLDRVN